MSKITRGFTPLPDGVAPLPSTTATAATDVTAVDAATLARALRGAVGAVPDEEARPDGLGVNSRSPRPILRTAPHRVRGTRDSEIPSSATFSVLTIQIYTR